MKKYLQKKLNNEKGMTLIELLAVIVIIAIIAAIAIPAIGNIIENSRVGAAKSDALSAISAAELYLADNPTATTVLLADLEDGYIDDAGTLTGFTYTPAGAADASFAGASTVDGGIAITYAAGTTKADVSALPNNSETGDGDTISITGR
ncbi:prepilin-type N-terminal cleavage/methylation domain-containing protein [Planococcus alpniumensis]|uniref:prepilin-type N-terminal cleavage/methylation domain-containing protein n=1 Tax=Planococcus alpniumensis TaxID=2708345 RepID=UPI001B8BE7FA|nr:prepilin-type N-terminal cleavage/methylation domain-containing protein [Planococcus sp. MSAK28401]